MWSFNVSRFLLRLPQRAFSYIYTKLQDGAVSFYDKMPVHVDGGAVLHRNINSEPPTVIKAVGNWLYLDDGRKLYDASCGASVSCLGHGSIKRIEAATIRAMRSVSYVSSLDFVTAQVKELCQFLVDSTNGGMARAVIYSSGSEAMEACMKLAKQYFIMKEEPFRVNFISRKQSYHGATLGVLGLTGHIGRRAYYEDILKSASHISPFNPYHDMSADESEAQYIETLVEELEAKFQDLGPETVAAVVFEPIVGAALGCVPGTEAYFKAMALVCREHGALLIFDEVMCGMGRTGTLHAYQQFDVVPDMMAIGKGLGAGFAPVAGMLVSHRVTDVLAQNGGAFVHGHTYQNHAVGSAVALEVQRIIRDENLLKNVCALGSLLGDLLETEIGHLAHVGNIRGMGFFWGIEFVKDKVTKTSFSPALNVSWRLHELTMMPKYQMCVYPGTGTNNGIEGDHVIISPPYNISENELRFMVKQIAVAIKDFFAQPEFNILEV